jgi:hypothetical protein
VVLCAAVLQSVRNTTRLCAHILTGSCLLVKSPDVSSSSSRHNLH